MRIGEKKRRVRNPTRVIENPEPVVIPTPAKKPEEVPAGVPIELPVSVPLEVER